VARFRIIICRGPECGERRGSAALHDVFRDVIEANGVRDSTELVWQSCFGRCTQGPNVLVREVVAPPPSTGAYAGGLFATLPGPRGVTALYNRMDASRVERVVVDHVKRGEIVREFIERPGIHPHDPVASSKP
jgi:(2Fe-2S) ferredoxin